MQKHDIKLSRSESDGFSYRRRIQFMQVICVLLFTLIAGRLIYLQVVLHSHYSERSRANRVTIQPIPPVRGVIYDRNLKPISYNTLVHSLEVESNTTNDLYKLVSSLSELLDITENKQRQFYEGYFLNPSLYSFSVILKSNLSQEEVMKFSANRYKYSGVRIKSKWQRSYIDKSSSSYIGFVGRISKNDLNEKNKNSYAGIDYIGKQGLEKIYEERLRGKSGYVEYEVTPQGSQLRNLRETPAKKGIDLILSIDSDLQRYGYHLFNERAGALVALDPRNGEVLSLISSPTFDSNLFVTGIDHATYNDYLRVNALFNRAIGGLYPPASTIKPMLSFGALRDDLIEHDEQIECKGKYFIPNLNRRWYRPFRDWLRTGHGKVSMQSAIAQSCDVYFFNLAYRAKIARIYKTLSWFKFGDVVLDSFPGEVKGLLPSDDWKRKRFKQPWLPGDTINVGIGQGYLQTSIMQLANATAIIANRGEWARPHLVIKKGNDHDLKKSFTYKAQTLATAEEKEYFKIIISGMKDVISESGTAKNLIRTSDIPIAAKTGTAQVAGLERIQLVNKNKALVDHSLFIAFAPIDNPRIAVASIVENAGSGSYSAGRLTTAFIDYYLGVSQHEQ